MCCRGRGRFKLLLVQWGCRRWNWAGLSSGGEVQRRAYLDPCPPSRCSDTAVFVTLLSATLPAVLTLLSLSGLPPK